MGGRGSGGWYRYNKKNNPSDYWLLSIGNPNVKYWVRNLERQPKSFWLQTSTDKFYPDFVAMLNDGRVLVVEYKGQHLIDGEQEKLNLGQLWASKSNGKALFLMAVKKDSLPSIHKQIEDVIG
jgi:type III restriction enzyme